MLNTNFVSSIYKPIAFCISKDQLKEDVIFYSDKIKFYKQKIQDYNLYIWHIGNLPEEFNNEKFFFSFPQTDSLLDRNIVITINKGQIQIENDWLGSVPVFYNKKNLIVSTLPNLCLKEKEFDPEGLQNFFEFGYSVFEHTPFNHVRFLRYYSKLLIEKDDISIEYKDDPILSDKFFAQESTTNEAIDLIKKYVKDVEQKTTGTIILPTSGGYDSRLLNWLINDKSRICSYTYGISKDQSKSSEVIRAKKIAEVLGTNWKQIELTHYHNYLDDWYRLFGFSSHLHGMYHIEFYNKIMNSCQFSEDTTFLSGIIGDAWAGSIDKIDIKCANDIVKLGYSHGMNLDEDFLVSKIADTLKNNYYVQNNLLVTSYQVQIVFMMRMKLVLLSYLYKVPEFFGIPSWTPFLSFDVATTMLKLPYNLRAGRTWQRDLFRNVGLDVENMNLTTSKANDLSFQNSKNHRFEPINENLFRGIIISSKIKELNKRINNVKQRHILFEWLLVSMKIRAILRRMGIKKIGYTKHLSNYYVLKAIEKSIK